MVRSDNACAYPVIDGIPILADAGADYAGRSRRRSLDLRDVKYAEAYEEMTFYNQVAKAEAAAIRRVRSVPHGGTGAAAAPEERGTCPEPKENWIDCVPDCKAQYEAYRYLEPFNGKRMLQLGGKGIHAVKLLAGGRVGGLGDDADARRNLLLDRARQGSRRARTAPRSWSASRKKFRSSTTCSTPFIRAAACIT